MCRLKYNQRVSCVTAHARCYASSTCTTKVIRRSGSDSGHGGPRDLCLSVSESCHVAQYRASMVTPAWNSGSITLRWVEELSLSTFSSSGRAVVAVGSVQDSELDVCVGYVASGNRHGHNQNCRIQLLRTLQNGCEFRRI